MSETTSLHIRNAISGDGDSVAWLVGRLTPLLRSQAFYRLGPQLAAAVEPDDIVAEAWLATLPRLRSLDVEGKRATRVLLSYLAAVIRNQCNQRLRRLVRRGSEALYDEVERSLPDEVADVLRNAMLREEARWVAKQLDGLSLEGREIVVLRAVEGLSNVEAARAMRVDPNTASKRYERAIKQLREQCGRSVFTELPDPDAAA